MGFTRYPSQPSPPPQKEYRAIVASKGRLPRIGPEISAWRNKPACYGGLTWRSWTNDHYYDLLAEINREGQMSKILTLMALAALLLVLNFGDAALAQMGRQQQMQGGSAGNCPVGTCNKMGGTFAKDVKYCSAANCKKPSGKQQ
jgi:hypothetical protein